MANRPRGRIKARKGPAPGRPVVSSRMKWPIVALVVAIMCAASVLAWYQLGKKEGGTGGGGNNDVLPRAKIATDKDSIYEGDTVRFSGESSLGDLREYLWEFGDGATGTGPTVTHSYGNVGKMAVQLTVKDSKNRGHTDTAYVHVLHHEQVAGIASLGQNKDYMIPVELDCLGARITLEYPSGQLVGGKPSNILILELYYPNGTKYLDSASQAPDPGTTQVRILDIPQQEMAASTYNNWKARVACTSGLNINFDLDIVVKY